ncbi:hypothetical protein TFLX_02595 [Thermoflexales bacterium]|nr:hypothetical protein TFLX_02595 [Thermoflexales bacterium]
MRSIVVKLHRQLKVLIWGLTLLGVSSCSGTGPEVHAQVPILSKFELQSTAHLAWSTDGTQIVVARNGDLWLIRITDGNTAYLTKGEGASWSPDGRMLAVFRGPLSGGTPGYFQIAFVTPEGKELNAISAGMILLPKPTSTLRPTDPNDHELMLTMVSRNPYFTGLDWSPDGQSLVYSIVSPDEERGDLFVINRDGSGLRRLTPVGYSTEPTWSPRADRIIYAYSAPYNTPGDLIMTTSKGECHLRLTQGSGVNTPVWSPDGRKIALSSSGSIYILDVAKYLSDEHFDPKQCKQ